MMTFEDAAAEADQEFELSKDPKGEIEYVPKITKFSSVHHLTMHFPKILEQKIQKFTI